MFRKSSRKADRVVRRTLADGTVKEYRYKAYRPKQKKRPVGDTLGALILAWQMSPEWSSLAKNTKAGYVTYLRPFNGMRAVQAAKIERRELIEIRNAIATAKGKGAATGFIRTASALFGWGVENGWLKHSPCVRIRRLEGGHLPAWTEADAATAIKHLPEYLRRPVVLALYTGQRRGDLIGLTWNAYDGARLTLRQEKTGAALVIPVHPDLKAELDTWRGGDVRPLPSARILTNTKGHPWNPSNMSKQLQTALARIPGFPTGRNIHGLRKLAAAALAEAGCTLHEIAAITGHRTLSMLQLYTASADQERLAKSAMNRVQFTKAGKRSEHID